MPPRSLPVASKHRPRGPRPLLSVLLPAVLTAGALVVALVVPDAALGFAASTRTTIFVSPSGSDANTGRSPAAAFRGIARALRFARPNDVIEVLGGTYSPITISVPGITVHGNGKTAVVGRAGLRDNIFVNADNVTVSNLDVRGCVPNANPSGGINNGASAGVRVGSGHSGVVLDHLTVHDSHGLNADRLPFGCYGVQLVNTTNTTVSNSTIFHNGEGISVFGGGQGVVLSNNTVHDQDVTMNNTAAVAGDDWGAVGISFTNANGTTAIGNTLYNNYGADHDFGIDGGAFEIFQSSNVAMTNNTIANNVDILETGAGGTNDCDHNSFVGNTATGRTTGSALKIAAGLILRCAKNMTVSANKISNVDWWTFWIYQRNANGSNGGSVGGLSITQNVITQGLDQIYAMGYRPATVNNNRYSYRGAFGTLPNGTQVRTLAAWTKSTGFDTVTGH